MQARAPKRVLSVLNEAILRQRGDERFCTVAFLRVYPVRGGVRRITVGCGGHPLPLVLRADGSIETAGVPGTLLGVLPGAQVEEYSLTLNPGDAIVLYTDGVIEARNGDGQFGEHGLRGVLATLAGESAQQIASAVASAAVGIQPGIRDDIAVVALRVPPTSA
jgi:sigma-B regulation protein RsbU (phosphoserine phosphatase)